MTRLIFLGPPGAGKGTQAQALAQRDGLTQIATGNILRQAVAAGTALGKEAQGFMQRGELVPDQLMVALVRERLSREAASWILDGFPRTQVQAEALQATLAELHQPLTWVIEVQVPDDLIVARLTGRRVCRQCEAPFHVQELPPQREGICDRCGGELYQRADDVAETVLNRLNVYHAQTAPLLTYYRELGLLRSVDGTQAVGDVLAEIDAILGVRV